VAFTKTGLKVLGYGFDRNFGGRNFDEALFSHLADEFKGKYGIDVRSHARASLRLRIQCEKTKKVLSSNPECPFAVECLMNDVDVKAHLTRDLFEQLAEPLFARCLAPAQAALAESGLTAEDISGVEIVGGASRLPALCKAVEGFFGKPLRRTMNAAESVARGCALQGAMLSPAFHVTRRFEVEDAAVYPVAFSWPQSEDEPGGESTSSLVFPKGNPMPSVKSLTFFRTGMFTLDAAVTDPALLSHPADAAVASFDIGPLPAPKAGGKAKLKVKVKLNLHGLLQMETATVLEEEEAAEGDAPMADADAPPPADGAAEPKKVKVTKTEVPFVTRCSSIPPAALAKLSEKEFEMALQDRVMEETKEKKNALEAYVLSMRSRLTDALAPYTPEETKASFGEALAKTEDWLYDEGEDESKGVYASKFAELKAIGDAIEERQREEGTREPAVAALRASAESTLSAASQPHYAHIDAGQLASVRKEAQAALDWLADKVGQQAKLAKWEQPAFTARECQKKAESLERFVKPIFATPKPAPPPEAMETESTGPVAEDLD
jgi:heat shock protein 4